MKDETLENLLLNEMKVVFKYLLKIGVRKEDAEDIVQDTICKAIVNIDSLNVDKISSWLFKVALNSYYNLIKKNKRNVGSGLEFTKDDINNISSNLLTEEYVVAKECNDIVLKVLNSLKPVDKKLLVLKYFLNLSYQEIANLLDIKQVNIKTYLYRAREQFRRKWEEFKYER